MGRNVPKATCAVVVSGERNLPSGLNAMGLNGMAMPELVPHSSARLAMLLWVARSQSLTAVLFALSPTEAKSCRWG